MVTYTPQLFIFDNITQLTIVIVCTILYFRTKALYSLSLEKGIKYLNSAMFFYIFNIGFKYLNTIFDFFLDKSYGTFFTSVAGMVFTFLSMYAAFMGGFYLGYCLVWRRFEKDSIKKFHIWRYIINIAALVIIATDMYLVIKYKFPTTILFFGIIMPWLVYAIVVNYKHCKKLHRYSENLNPFLALVGMGLAVYVSTLIETLLIPFLFTIHYYTWAASTVFSLAFLYQVMKISK